MFQSHAGSIEAAQLFRNAIKQIFRFNPTLVRLRRGRELAEAMGWAVFQSHAGSIEALGALRQVILEAIVSIPRWFD